VRLSDFDYDLPRELIAQAPLEPRDAARLLVLERESGGIAHHHVFDLPELLRPGDVLVANRSRVLPARVHGRLRGGGQAELLLLRRQGIGQWEALVRPARRLRVGDVVSLDGGLSVKMVAALPDGIRAIEIHGDVADPDAALLAQGSTPLPPYIRGWLGDPERYPTIFADVEGSAAAPTAGLHFTQDLLGRLAARGVDFTTLVLHIGLDTFRPITHNNPTEHPMHREWYEVPAQTIDRIERAKAEGRRVIAVGTTVVRALETWALTGQAEGWSELFIAPGHGFVVVEALLTNFHLPRSTLLMLVSALAGRDHILAAYGEAISRQYRFYSFGDAMLIR
jgi:S-adenosylmethionine:tRNA ribosyltransferase-isomerase